MVMPSCAWCTKALTPNETLDCRIVDIDDDEDKHQLCSSCQLTGHACQSSCPCCWFDFGQIFVQKSRLCAGCLQPVGPSSSSDLKGHRLCRCCSQCLLCSFRHEMKRELFSLSYREQTPLFQTILYKMQRCVQQIEIEREPCSICMERLHGDKPNPVRTLSSCQHRFHQSCIEKWFKQKPCCPCCRQSYQNDAEPKLKRIRRDHSQPFQLQNHNEQTLNPPMDTY